MNVSHVIIHFVYNVLIILCVQVVLGLRVIIIVEYYLFAIVHNIIFGIIIQMNKIVKVVLIFIV